MRAFESRYGLSAVAGGRHPGVGTANAIVPLGGSQYLELITVVDRDEAERAPLRSRVLAALDSGATFAGWAVRADDLEATAAAIELGPGAEGARERPDGTRLEWRTAEVAGALTSAVPFLIEWRSREHPGAGGSARRVSRVVVQDAGDSVRDLLTRVDLDVAVELVAGPTPRLEAVQLDGLTIR